MGIYEVYQENSADSCRKDSRGLKPKKYEPCAGKQVKYDTEQGIT